MAAYHGGQLGRSRQRSNRIGLVGPLLVLQTNVEAWVEVIVVAAMYLVGSLGAGTGWREGSEAMKEVVWGQRCLRDQHKTSFVVTNIHYY